MFHEESIHAMTFSDDGEILASGDKVGCMKIWKVQSGKCLKKIDNSIGESISVMRFGKDQSKLIVGYSKNLIRIYGLKSSAILMEHRVSKEGIVNDILVFPDDELLSAGSDGFLRVWNTQTGEQKM